MRRALSGWHHNGEIGALANIYILISISDSRCLRRIVALCFYALVGDHLRIWSPSCAHMVATIRARGRRQEYGYVSST